MPKYNRILLKLSGGALAGDYKMPMHIFDFYEKGSMKRIVQGETAGTTIAGDCPVEMYG